MIRFCGLAFRVLGLRFRVRGIAPVTVIVRDNGKLPYNPVIPLLQGGGS